MRLSTAAVSLVLTTSLAAAAAAADSGATHAPLRLIRTIALPAKRWWRCRLAMMSMTWPTIRRPRGFIWRAGKVPAKLFMFEVLQ
jgi:hypothetical protein